MQYVLYALPVLACPIGIGVMMWLMMRGTGADNRRMTGVTRTNAGSLPPPDIALADAGHEAEVAEVAELRARLSELEARNRVLREELGGPQPVESAATLRESEPIRSEPIR